MLSIKREQYLNDIIERNDVMKKDVLDIVINILSSSIG
mgnify:CR=1 FL=1